MNIIKNKKYLFFVSSWQTLEMEKLWIFSFFRQAQDKFFPAFFFLILFFTPFLHNEFFSPSLSELNQKHDVAQILPLSSRMPETISSQNFGADFFSPTQNILSELIITRDSGETLLLRSTQKGNLQNMREDYENIPEITAVEENISGFLFDDGNSSFMQKIPLSFSEKEISEENPIVAVMDSGIDILHDDLSDAVWQNIREVNGHKGIDDDQNGFSDDISGWNFVDNTADVSDYQGHGTHLSGIISMKPSTDEKANPPARIMALKVSGTSKKVRLSDVLSALSYARENGADIVNMSFGFSHPSKALHNLLSEMRDEGIFLVSAAGNSETNKKYYPAAYEEVFSVGSIDITGKKRKLSNFGDSIDASFPGVFTSTLPGNRYGRISGTSQSAAFATLLAAQIKRENPSVTKEEISSALIQISKMFSQNFTEYFNGDEDSDQKFLTFSEMGHMLKEVFGDREEILSLLREEYKSLFPLNLTSYHVLQIALEQPTQYFVRKYEAKRILESARSYFSSDDSVFHSAADSTDQEIITTEEFLLLLEE